jgi:hypothetical protein
MELKDYFDTIRTAGDIPGSREKIVLDIYASAKINFAESTILASIKGKRKPKYDSGSVSEDGFINYFRSRTTSTWENMQREFCKLDTYGIIDCDTDDAEEFYRSLLNLFYELIRLHPVSLCHVLPKKPKVFGRENELKSIAEIFKENNYVVLSGVGGIGKSYVALAYAHSLNESSRCVIQHIICNDNDSLRDVVARLQFEGLVESKNDNKNEKFDRRMEILKNRSQSMLIIFDNLNQTIEQSDRCDFNQLKACGTHIKFLITSRNDKILGDNQQYVVRIKPLEIDTLLEFYSYHRFEEPYHHKDYIKEHGVILKEMFMRVCYHTLMIELLARLSRNSSMNEKEINEMLKEGLDISPETVYVEKDEKVIENSVLRIVKIIFTMSSLNDIEKDILRCLALVPPSGIELKLFKELAGYDKDSDIFRLRDRGWVVMKEGSRIVSLHPLISEAILNERTIRPFKVEGIYEMFFINNVKAKLKDFVKDSREWLTLSKTLVRYITKIEFPPILAIAPYLKKEYETAILVFNDLNKDMMEYWDINSPELKQMNTLVKNLSTLFAKKKHRNTKTQQE